MDTGDANTVLCWRKTSQLWLIRSSDDHVEQSEIETPFFEASKLNSHEATPSISEPSAKPFHRDRDLPSRAISLLGMGLT